MRKYKTDSQLKVCMERLDESAEQQKAKFFKLFKVVNPEESKSLCGNIRVFFKKGKARLGTYATDRENLVSSHEQISSALALYRAVSIFQTGTNPETQDFYKCNWSVCLKHEITGQYLMLGEWKGGFQIFTEAHSLSDLNIRFIKDAEAFLTWFVSDKVSIGYDDTIAGTVA